MIPKSFEMQTICNWIIVVDHNYTFVWVIAQVAQEFGINSTSNAIEMVQSEAEYYLFILW